MRSLGKRSGAKKQNERRRRVRRKGKGKDDRHGRPGKCAPRICGRVRMRGRVRGRGWVAGKRLTLKVRDNGL